MPRRPVPRRPISGVQAALVGVNDDPVSCDSVLELVAATVAPTAVRSANDAPTPGGFDLWPDRSHPGNGHLFLFLR